MKIMRRNVRKSVNICKNAYRKENCLEEFEVVFTIFYENQEYLKEISKESGNVPLVLQQGEHKIPVVRTKSALNMTNGEYIWKKRIQQEHHPPLTLDEIKEIADKLEEKCTDSNT